MHWAADVMRNCSVDSCFPAGRPRRLSCGTRRTLLWLIAAALPLGCATTANPRFFYGHAIHQPSGQTVASGMVSARGVVTGQELEIHFSYEGRQPPHLNYSMDEYVAKTYDGRIITLEKGDVIEYPDAEGFGSDRPVKLRMPNGVAAHELTHIYAGIEYNKTIVDLTPLSAPAQEPLNALSPMLGPGQSVGDARPAWPEAIKAMAPDALSSRTAETIAAPGAVPISPVLDGPPGSVPVEVTFEQELGSTLTIELKWNPSHEPLSLSTGERHTFYVLPGQHELHFACRLPFIAKTEGQLPLYIVPEKPIRIALEAQARLNGADLRARVWQGDLLLGDRHFTPTAASALSILSVPTALSSAASSKR